MSILIKGMNMPKPDESVVIVISNENGVTVAGEDEYCGADYPAVSIPPHGRLIDADTLYKVVEGSRNVNPHKKDEFKRAHEYEHSHFLCLITEQRTIIEAEEEHDESISS